MPKYKVFDLIWDSKNLELPGIKKVFEDQKADVEIIEDNNLNFSISNQNKLNTDYLTFEDGNLTLDIQDIAYFKIVEGRFIYWKKKSISVTDQDIRTFLLGSIFGTILIQRDYLVLHGSALAKDEKAILFLGDAGQGKSTIAYSLLEQGWKLLADDLIAIDQNNFVLPGIPRIKLWIETLEKFNLDKNNFSRVRQNVDKYELNSSCLNIQTSKVKLHNIFILKKGSHKEIEGEIKVDNIKNQKEKLLVVRNLSYRPRIIKGSKKEDTLFSSIARLVIKKEVNFLSMPSGIKLMKKALLKYNFIDYEK